MSSALATRPVGVPVQLVVVGESVEGVADAVGDSVRLLTGDELVRVADSELDVCARAAARVRPRFAERIGHGDDVEAVDAVVLVVARDAVLDRDLAEDAMLL